MFHVDTEEIMYAQSPYPDLGWVPEHGTCHGDAEIQRPPSDSTSTGKWSTNVTTNFLRI